MLYQTSLWRSTWIADWRPNPITFVCSSYSEEATNSQSSNQSIIIMLIIMFSTNEVSFKPTLLIWESFSPHILNKGNNVFFSLRNIRNLDKHGVYRNPNGEMSIIDKTNSSKGAAENRVPLLLFWMGQIIAPCRLIVEESAAKYNLQTMGTKKQASLGMSDCWTIKETSGKKTFSFLRSL